MDGSKAAKHVIGSQQDIEFSNILFTTNAHVSIPLLFFQNGNLTLKSNPLLGKTKGQFILNIADMTKGTKGCKSFGDELSLDFGEWSEAAQNCFRFHQLQDRDGDMGPYTTWWSSHFNFFNAQEDKITQYNAWKELELKLHHEYWTEPTKFDINHYTMKYKAAKMTYELKLLIEKQYLFPSAPLKDAPPPSHKDGFFHHSFRGGKFSGDHHQSFLQGSRHCHPGTNLLCCILCSELGHPVSKHYNNGISATKFLMASLPGQKISNDSLCAPNGKELCINYNIGRANTICYHSDGARAHLCSYCGSKSHYAFAWVCCTRPVPPAPSSN